MAIWQFDIELLPVSAIESDDQLLDHSLTDDGLLDSSKWWSATPLSPEIEALLDDLLPRGKSWSASMDLWGDEKGNRVDVYREADNIESILVRIDVRELDLDFLKGVCGLARAIDCKLCAMEGPVIVEPSPDSLRFAIHSSSAKRFVIDPEKYLSELADSQ